MQSWIPNHAAIEIGSLESVDEFVSIAELAGYQMARGHTSVLPPPHDRQVRELVKAMLVEEERAIRTAVHDLADVTVGAYRDVLSRAPSR